mmetsp:Transcript_139234/g.361876  ORF Transcript_139234/g.361876 Transcript_139234/m.361876 type:complete len:99 (+) Transcript_139234:81-377(+)
MGETGTTEAAQGRRATFGWAHRAAAGNIILARGAKVGTMGDIPMLGLLRLRLCPVPCGEDGTATAWWLFTGGGTQEEDCCNGTHARAHSDDVARGGGV